MPKVIPMICAALMLWSSSVTARETLAVGACVADVRRICAGITPGEDRIRRCVREHIRELSGACLITLANGVMLVTNSSQHLYGGMIGWPFQVAALSPIRKLLVIFFLIEGGASIMFAFEHRRHFTRRWAWMVLSGIVDLILGTLIILDLPGTSEWTMGLLIGINMIFGGSALIAMGSSFPRAIRVNST